MAVENTFHLNDRIEWYKGLGRHPWRPAPPYNCNALSWSVTMSRNVAGVSIQSDLPCDDPNQWARRMVIGPELLNYIALTSSLNHLLLPWPSYALALPRIRLCRIPLLLVGYQHKVVPIMGQNLLLQENLKRTCP